jgi:hypothetical protein
MFLLLFIAANQVFSGVFFGRHNRRRVACSSENYQNVSAIAAFLDGTTGRSREREERSHEIRVARNESDTVVICERVIHRIAIFGHRAPLECVCPSRERVSSQYRVVLAEREASERTTETKWKKFIIFRCCSRRRKRILIV